MLHIMWPTPLQVCKVLKGLSDAARGALQLPLELRRCLRLLEVGGRTQGTIVCVGTYVPRVVLPLPVRLQVQLYLQAAACLPALRRAQGVVATPCVRTHM